ncbi:MAG: ankyrin repeat domain-containing protein [Blastocatellia bacterium]
MLLFGFTVACLAFGFQQKSESYSPTQPVNETELREASARAIKLIQHAQADWYKKETCSSCHNQLLPEIPISLARQRGVALDEPAARQATTASFACLKDLDAVVQGYDYIDVMDYGWRLVTAHAAGIAPSLTTSAHAQVLASRQQPDGSWFTTDDRPPQSYSSFTATVVCAHAIRLYLPDWLKGESDSRTRRARKWLLKTPPQNTEERVYQLLGLYWTGADLNARKQAAQRLIAEQLADGGWRQMGGLSSDAYSTGEVLFALREGAGLPASDPTYQRGLRFLLKTQQADGSWHVTSRLHPPAPVSPPYFETGFPYQHDQFISLMGSAWAAAAMLEAIPAKAVTASPTGALALTPAEQAEWVAIALNGSAADLKRLLDAGLNPNSKTAEGTTALMMAARDLEKVKLLIERGADVNARAATGITPLMAAAQYTGNVEVVRLLLKKGARPNPDQGVEVRNDASAIFYAMMAFDVEVVKALADAGANVNARMKIIGRFPSTPLMYTVSGTDSTMVEYLFSKGANPNEVDGDGISVLGWAAIINRPNTVKALLTRGADVNHVDRFGMTPLLYAASINFGDTEVLDRLIAAGADLKATNKQGQTAADLARAYNHTAMTSRLAGKTAAR